MNRPLFLRLAVCAALLASAPSLSAQTYPLGPEDGISFDQVGFDFGGGFAYPYSAWGGLWIRPSTFCERAPMSRGYINV